MRRTQLPALAILALLALTSAGFAVLEAGSDVGQDAVESLLITHGLFTLVGAWILLARPGNRIGWLFAVVGLLAMTGQLAQNYSIFALVEVTAADAPPFGVAAAWYAEWYWMPWLFLFLSGTSLLFPTGRPLSRRWGHVAWSIAITAAILTVLTAMDPVLDVDSLEGDANPSVEVSNPIGISPFGDPDEAPLVFLFLPLLFLSAITAVISLVMRFKCSSGEEREQMKWMVSGAVVMVGGFILFGALDGFGYDVPDVLEGTLTSILPLAAAAAILRHRLYDIDVVINRTLVYGLLTAILAAAYLGIVVTLQSVLAGVTEESDLAVAASTLAVAALFGPLRSRVQVFIDQRFYRRKYDAATTLDSFSSRLRDQVDLESVRSELVGVVGETMQPAHLSLWFRTARHE